VTPVRVLLVGKAGAGKDTVADHLVRRYGFVRYAFADRLKEIARDLFPEAFVGPKPRALLQNLGEAVRRVDPDVWARYVLRRVEAENPARAVITDCRYANEFELCSVAGFLPVLVSCPDEVRRARLAARGDAPLSAEEAAHPSEHEAAELAERQPHRLAALLVNDGPPEWLYRQVDGLMSDLGVGPVLPTDTRPTWAETFMRVARVVAERSTCLRRKVGAVLVRDARIIATGYNGAPKGMEHCVTAGCLREENRVPSGERHELCRAVHAEENCVIQAAVFGVSTVGAELYVTCHPCSMCARTLINAGVKKVFYAGDYPDPLAARLFAEAGVEALRLA
jgi:dCMP deaminase